MAGLLSLGRPRHREPGSANSHRDRPPLPRQQSRDRPTRTLRPSALLIYRQAQANPIFSIRHAARQANLTFPTASAAIRRLTDAGILHESSDKRRDRLFLYAKYLEALNRDL